MSTIFYREPSRLKRWWSHFYDRHLVKTIVRAGYEFRILRMRWWLPVMVLVLWVFANIFALFAAMGGAGTGSPNRILFAPLYWLFG